MISDREARIRYLERLVSDEMKWARERRAALAGLAEDVNLIHERYGPPNNTPSPVTGPYYLKTFPTSCSNPVPSATVTLTGPTGAVYYSGPGSWGTLTTYNVPLGTYTLTATAPGWIDGSASITVTSSNSTSGTAATLILTLQPQPDGSGFDPCSCASLSGLTYNAYHLPIYPANDLTVTDPAGNVFTISRMNGQPINSAASGTATTAGPFWGAVVTLPTAASTYGAGGCTSGLLTSSTALLAFSIKCPLAAGSAAKLWIDYWANTGGVDDRPSDPGIAWPNYPSTSSGACFQMIRSSLAGTVSSVSPFHFTSGPVSGLGTDLTRTTSASPGVASVEAIMGWASTGTFEIIG